MGLNNCFTAGTQGILVSANPTKSLELLPSNEDWSLAVKIISLEDSSQKLVVVGTKIWAETDEIFRAVAKFHGKTGKPDISSFEVGQTAIFHRTGDFDGYGEYGYQLHDKSNAGTSWIVFAPTKPAIFVEDFGNGTGLEVKWDGTSWQPVDITAFKPLKTLDPISMFHNEKPPFKTGRIYLAVVHEGIFFVDLQGHGDMEKEFTVNFSDSTISLRVDGAGNVIDFLRI